MSHTPPDCFPNLLSTCSILSQPSETPTQDRETSWCSGRPEKTRICGGDMSCCFKVAWVSTENCPYPHLPSCRAPCTYAHTAALSRAAVGAHQVTHTPGCHVPALLPKVLGSGAALRLHELGVLHTQPLLPAQGTAQGGLAAPPPHIAYKA